MFHVKMEIWVIWVNINKFESYQINEYNIFMINIDFSIHNKQSDMGYIKSQVKSFKGLFDPTTSLKE